jgi:hypothetical protein
LPPVIAQLLRKRVAPVMSATRVGSCSGALLEGPPQHQTLPSRLRAHVVMSLLEISTTSSIDTRVGVARGPADPSPIW